MKRLFTSLAFVLAILLTACQQEVLELDNIAEAMDGKVTIGVGVDDLPMSRSGEELAPNRFIMEVYAIDLDMVGEPIPFDQIRDSVYCATEGRFSIELTEGQHYTLLFWADYVEDSPNNVYGNLLNAYNGYNIMDLKDVRIEEPNMPVAFAGSVSFCYEAAATVKPYLKNTITHSVGQVNFVQTKAISTTGNSLSINFLKSYRLNVDGLTISESEYAPDCYVGFDAVEADSVICTTYIIAENENSSVMDVEYYYNNNERQTISNVPFQRNYRTFIRGDFSGIQGIGGEDIEIDVEENWNAGETPKPEYTGYKIGDPYPSEVSPYGVVYEVDSTGTAGKIISMDRRVGFWSERAEVTGATNEDDGLANMAAVASINRSFDMYNSFYWVHQKNMQANIDPKEYATGTKGVWYLPAYNEVVEIFKLKDITTLNTTLRAYGAEEIPGRIVSSTEYDKERAYMCDRSSSYSINVVKNYFGGSFIYAMMAFDADTKLPKRPEPEYEVGDLYPKDGDPIGVVYEVNFDGKSGRIVSLLEKYAQTPFTRSAQENINTGAYSATDGMSNTAAVMAMIDYNSYNYPAIAWVDALNTQEVDYTTAKNGVWYLPTFYDLESMYHVQATIMSTLSNTPGATILDPHQYYLSSTQSIDTDGSITPTIHQLKFSIDPLYNSGRSDLSLKNTVRAVMKFNDEMQTPILPQYKVGDLYEVDGKPVGVVYQINDKEGYSGRAISLNVATKLAWYYGGPNVVNGPDYTTLSTNAKDEDNGLVNMDVIVNHYETIDDFPAFKFVDAFNVASAATAKDLNYYKGSTLHKWYLPARHEVYKIADEIDEINTALEKLDCSLIGANNVLATSTQYGDKYTWTYRPCEQYRGEQNDHYIYSGDSPSPFGHPSEIRGIIQFDTRENQ